MVLHANRNAKFRSSLSALFDRAHHQVPLRRKTLRGMFVSGEDAHQATAKVPGQPRQLGDVVDLHFPLRDLTVLQVRREVVVPGDAGFPQFAFLEMLAQAGTLLVAVIEHAQVRTLGPQHYTVEAQVGGLINKLIERQRGLAPGPGVADGVEK